MESPYRCIYCHGPVLRVHYGMDGVTRYQCQKCHEVSGSYLLEKDIKEVLDALSKKTEVTLLKKDQRQLEDYWHFSWDKNMSAAYNTYRFMDNLESYRRNCRKWEEQHNGTCCVVERVRDEYLMPKIRAFLSEMATHE